MKFTCLVLLLVLVIPKAKAQNIFKNEKVSIEIKKYRPLKKMAVTLGTPHLIKIDHKTSKQIQVRIKITSLNKKAVLFDPNRFSLAVDQCKVRYSLSEINYTKRLTMRTFSRLSTSPSTGDNGYQGYLYEPEVPNTFTLDSIPGFSDCQTSLNFGNKRSQDTHIIYYKPSKVKKEHIDLFFIVPKGVSEGTLYYGNKKITAMKLIS